MTRIDVWDVVPEDEELYLDCGYPRNFAHKYAGPPGGQARELGKGGFGSVRVVVDRLTGEELACKSIAKRLNVPNLSVQVRGVSSDPWVAHLDDLGDRAPCGPSVMRRSCM